VVKTADSKSLLTKSSIFDDYHIESKANDNIFIQLCGEHFIKSLKSGQKAVKVEMKLSKKNGLAVLSFLITTSTRTGKFMQLVQDVILW
jgi:hypothetical protein